MTNVDVTVLGGGPAGCAAALILARRGHSVIIVERSNYNRIRVGETLPPIAQRLLVTLGVWDRFLSQAHLPSFGICSAWGRDDLIENDFIFNPYGYGWHIDRARFDALLGLAASEAGVTVCPAAQLNVFGQDASGEWEIAIHSGARLHHYRTRFVIDASGRPASFARKRGAKRIPFDHLFGVVAFFSAPTSYRSSDSRTLVEAVEQGWWYSAPLPNSQLVIAYLTDFDLYPHRNHGRAAYFQEQLQHAPRTRARAKKHSITNGPLIFAANSSRLDRAAGKNWLAVGDAAMAFDPLSSQGICQALRSGMEAGHLIHAHWKSCLMPLGSYSRSLDRKFENYLNERNQYYGRENRWPFSTFWRRRTSVKAEV